MDKNERDALEAYRQERKERIAKQAKAAEKKGHGVPGAKNAVGKIISAVIAVVVVVAILAVTLNFFGAPQKMLKAVVIDGESYSMSELSCYYMQMYNNMYQTASQYDANYGEGYGAMLTGYDINISPADQTTTDEDGNKVTWDEYFLDQAIESMATIKRYYKAAVEAGVELGEEDEKEIQDTLDNFKEYSGSYSLSRFISLQFGKGVTTSLFTKILEEQKLVSVYQELKQEELKAEYSEDDVMTVYNSDKSEYDSVAFRWYTIEITSEPEETSSLAEDESSVETVSTYAEEAQAQAFIEKVKSHANYDEETFKQVVLETVGEDDENYEDYLEELATRVEKLDKASIEGSVNEEAAEWLYAADESGNYIRQYGDMNYFVSADASTVYILFALGTPYQDDTLTTTVRHILVKYPESAAEPVSGEESTDTEAATEISADVDAECQSEAQSILDDYNAYIKENTEGKPDEEYFGELASKLTDDTGSAESGGLVSGMVNDGTLVKEFEDWAFSEGAYEGEERKAGDTAIVNTEFGYHVMYYVEAEDHPDWYNRILEEKITEDWEAEQDKFEEQFGEDAIQRKEMLVARVKKACMKTIEQSLAY